MKLNFFIFCFRWATHLYKSLFPSIHPSVCHAPYLKNSTSFDHNFWYTRVQLRYLQAFFSIFIKFRFFGLLAGFPLLGDMGGSPLPLAQNLLIPPPLPTPGKIPLPPPPAKGSFPPINNNFLNGQNYFSSDSHHPIKKSPHCTTLHCTAIPLPLQDI